MPLVVAQCMADGQIVRVAVAALAQWLDVFKRCGLWQHMLPAHPARYYTVQLMRHCFVNFAPDVGEFAHVLLLLVLVSCPGQPVASSRGCGAHQAVAHTVPGHISGQRFNPDQFHALCVKVTQYSKQLLRGSRCVVRHASKHHPG